MLGEKLNLLLFAEAQFPEAMAQMRRSGKLFNSHGSSSTDLI